SKSNNMLASIFQIFSRPVSANRATHGVAPTDVETHGVAPIVELDQKIPDLNAPVIHRFAFGDYRDLPPHWQTETTLKGGVSNVEQLPRLMKAMVKMPEEVPHEMIWNTTYHHIRNWISYNKRPEGVMAQEQLALNVAPKGVTASGTIRCVNGTGMV